jgi:LmbE family N-acetylglucosaminyl deacetylase
MTTTLGIWAHPDDEVFVSGGFMADAVRRGDRVVCIHMTRGEAGLSYRRRCSPESLASIRQRELEASLARLGVEDQRFLGYPDGRLGHVPSAEVIARLHDALVEVKPDVILTFGPDGFTGHPDHKSLAAWVRAALDLWNERETRLYHAVVSREWKESFAPPLSEFDVFWPGHPIVAPYSDVTLNLDDELLAAKVEALREHASQMKPLFDAYGDDFMRAMAATEHFRLAPTLPPCSRPLAHARTTVPAATALATDTSRRIVSESRERSAIGSGPAARARR